VLIVLFSLGVTAEALRANIGSKSAISLQRGLWKLRSVPLYEPMWLGKGFLLLQVKSISKILSNDLPFL